MLLKYVFIKCSFVEISFIILDPDFKIIIEVKDVENCRKILLWPYKKTNLKEAAAKYTGKTSFICFKIVKI